MTRWRAMTRSPVCVAAAAVAVAAAGAGQFNNAELIASVQAELLPHLFGAVDKAFTKASGALNGMPDRYDRGIQKEFEERDAQIRACSQ